MLQEFRFAKAQERQALSTNLNVDSVRNAAISALKPVFPSIEEHVSTNVNKVDGQGEVILRNMPIMNRQTEKVELATATMKIIGVDQFVDLVIVNDLGEEVLFELADMTTILTLVKAMHHTTN